MQRWSPRGHILKSLALASKVKSLALRPQVLENWPVLGSRTARFFGMLKFWDRLKNVCEDLFFFFFFFGDRLKNFCEDLFFFFFWRALALCVLGPWPWAFLSLASRVSVLGKAVLGLGLGFFLCPWPWPRVLCPRLHLCKFGTKTRLKPSYEQLQVLNIDEIYKLEVVKFMAKVDLNKLSVFCSNQLPIFRTLSSIHTYLTQSISSKSFYVQRTSLVKTSQSLKISGVNYWNSLPRHIKAKVLTFSDKISPKILKLYFLKSRTCLYAKLFFTCVYIEMNAYMFVFACLILFFSLFFFFLNFFLIT